MAKLSLEAKKVKVINALKKGPLTMSKLVEASGLTPESLKEAVTALRADKKVETCGAGNKQLQLVKKTTKAPAKKAAPPVKTKRKAAPVEDDEDDEDEDEEEEDDEDEDPDEDEDDDEGSEDDEDGDDEDEDEDEDDEEDPDDEDEDEDEEEDDEDEDEDDEEDEEPAPKKKGKVVVKGQAKKAAPVKKAPAPAEDKPFTMSYAPIDTLDDKGLRLRIKKSLIAAEALYDDNEKLIAEMLMRSVSKAQRQLKKRSEA